MAIKRSDTWELARPRGNRVWGYPIYQEEKKSEGGLFLPGSDKKILYTLEVVRVGENVTDISEGDHVILDPNGGGQTVTLIDEKDEAHTIFVVHEKHVALVLG